MASLALVLRVYSPRYSEFITLERGSRELPPHALYYLTRIWSNLLSCPRWNFARTRIERAALGSCDAFLLRLPHNVRAIR